MSLSVLAMSLFANLKASFESRKLERSVTVASLVAATYSASRLMALPCARQLAIEVLTAALTIASREASILFLTGIN